MIVSLKSITSQAPNSYEVALEEADSSTRVFKLKVVEGDVDCVTWEDDLAEYMARNLGPASALFEAVLTFHRAQRLSVPDR